MKSLLIATVLTLSGLAVGQPPPPHSTDSSAHVVTLPFIISGQSGACVIVDKHGALIPCLEDNPPSAPSVHLPSATEWKKVLADLAALKQRVQKLETLLKAKEVKPEKPCTPEDNSGCVVPISTALTLSQESGIQALPLTIHDVTFSDDRVWTIHCSDGEPEFEPVAAILRCVKRWAEEAGK